MSYINGEILHPEYEISIEVLEPTKGESSYDGQMRVQVNWDTFLSVTLEEYREIIKWLSEKADYIEKNFTKSGKAKKIITKG